MKKQSILLVVFILFFVSNNSSATTASFQGIGDLPGGSFYSKVMGLSADGSTATGYSHSVLGVEAFVWTADDGMGIFQAADSTAKGATFPLMVQ